jgi:large subunit ribosomal protein L9
VEVILLENMNLGVLGQTVKVKRGFARNYLFPQGKAIPANAKNLAKVEERRAELEKRAAEKHAEALVRQQAIQALPVITIMAKASEEGKLFGSVNAKDLLESLDKMNVKVEKREIHLPQGSLRTTGEYDIVIDLGSDVTATIKINITTSN